jgi:hypothetical protein
MYVYFFRLSATAYWIHSQLPSIFGGRLLHPHPEDTTPLILIFLSSGTISHLLVLRDPTKTVCLETRIHLWPIWSETFVSYLINLLLYHHTKATIMRRSAVIFPSASIHSGASVSFWRASTLDTMKPILFWVNWAQSQFIMNRKRRDLNDGTPEWLSSHC